MLGGLAALLGLGALALWEEIASPTPAEQEADAFALPRCADASPTPPRRGGLPIYRLSEGAAPLCFLPDRGGGPAAPSGR